MTEKIFYEKHPVLAALLISLISIILTGVVTWRVGRKDSIEAVTLATKQIVDKIADKFDYVDREAGIDDVLSQLKKDYDDLEKKYSDLILEYNKEKERTASLNDEIESLEKELSLIPKYEILDVDFSMDGQIFKDNANVTMVKLESIEYISLKLLLNAFGENLIYKANEGMLYYRNKISENTDVKTDIFDTSVLYDGYKMTIYPSPDDESFSIGGSKYSSGFVLKHDNPNPYAQALFDFKGKDVEGKYAKVSFDVGRIVDSDYSDAVMKIHLNDELIQEAKLRANHPIYHFEIDLKYASSMTITIEREGGTAEYGFANIMLYN